MIMFIESIKAWWRGDKRVSPAKRGRIWEKKDKEPLGEAKSQSKGYVLTNVKVIRKDGSIEEYKNG